MEKVLILSCSTGQGHNSCAQALKEYLELQQIECCVLDALSFISKRFSKFLSWGHAFMYRHIPGLFRWGYRYFMEHPKALAPHSGGYRLLTSGVNAMRQYLKGEQFDTVICTHVFAAIMLTKLQKLDPLPIRTAFVATDYTCYPGMNACDLQRYFVSSPDQIDEYSECGIPKDRLIASGIPVRRCFFSVPAKEDAKQRLGISVHHKHLLVMCGSMGCGPIADILQYITQGLPSMIEVTVICGTNHQLYRKLERLYHANHRIHIIGYTDQIALYMAAADLYLTKPGGISTTEAAVLKLPMALIDAVAGCEQYNAAYFTSLGAAATANTPKELAEMCIRWLLSIDDAKNMANAFAKEQSSDGAAIIYHEMNCLPNSRGAAAAAHSYPAC